MTQQTKERVQYLLMRWLDRKSTAKEEALLFRLLEEEKENSEWESLVEELMESENQEARYDRREWESIVRSIISGDGSTGGLTQITKVDSELSSPSSTAYAEAERRREERRLFDWRRIAVAASILFAVAIGSYFLFFNKPTKPGQPVASVDVDAPNDTKATITLADGRKISIDSLTTMTQATVQLTKKSDGTITYQSGPDSYRDGSQESGALPAGRQVVYNTLNNPRGSKVVSLVLSDGTKVWLNAESSLKYPVSFVGSAPRQVEITGEAYFETAHLPASFKVVANGLVIEDLGTEFNVNAYADEEGVKTTLINGIVRVGNVQLKPGQQALNAQLKGEVDIEPVVAWKNGLFLVDNTDLPTIMRQIGRWYDVDVEFRGAVPDRKFGGGVSNRLPLSKVVELLESNNIHCKIENRKLIVQP
ncbi:MAG TPA: FecR domain-containing protein [Chitinophagaceae bacterium]|nr:FecR domain-containing protein [Chitinophagaceae bacterium]